MYWLSVHYFKVLNYSPTEAPPELVQDTTQKLTVSQQIFKKPKLSFDPSNCQVSGYCSTEVATQDTVILYWWSQHECILILAIPGLAVPSERINSTAREMLPYTRNRLGNMMVEATLVSKSFLKGFYAKSRLA